MVCVICRLQPVEEYGIKLSQKGWSVYKYYIIFFLQVTAPYINLLQLSLSILVATQESKSIASPCSEFKNTMESLHFVSRVGQPKTQIFLALFNKNLYPPHLPILQLFWAWWNNVGAPWTQTQSHGLLYHSVITTNILFLILVKLSLNWEVV